MGFSFFLFFQAISANYFEITKFPNQIAKENSEIKLLKIKEIQNENQIIADEVLKKKEWKEICTAKFWSPCIKKSLQFFNFMKFPCFVSILKHLQLPRFNVDFNFHLWGTLPNYPFHLKANKISSLYSQMILFVTGEKI